MSLFFLAKRINLRNFFVIVSSKCMVLFQKNIFYHLLLIGLHKTHIKTFNNFDSYILNLFGNICCKNIQLQLIFVKIRLKIKNPTIRIINYDEPYSFTQMNFPQKKYIKFFTATQKKNTKINTMKVSIYHQINRSTH